MIETIPETFDEEVEMLKEKYPTSDIQLLMKIVMSEKFNLISQFLSALFGFALGMLGGFFIGRLF